MRVEETAACFPRVRLACRALLPVAAAALIGPVGWVSRADAQVKGVAVSEDPVVKLTRQLAALEFRVKQLETGQAAIQQSLKKADVSDDGSGSDKKDKGGGNSSSGTSNKTPDGSAKKDPDPAKSAGTGDGNLKDVFPVMTLRAPFVVVDASGKPIFGVQDPRAKGGKGGSDRGAYVYGDAGVANFALTTVYGGGKLVIQNNAANRSMTLGSLDTAVGMKVRDGGQVRAYVGVDTKGRGDIAVFAGDGENMVAGMQSSDSNKGLIAVFNSGTPVAFLSQSGAHPGGGNVTTTDPAGNGVFSAGYDGEGASACVNHKQSLHCLGINLPLAGQ